jgi:hypothetical protein
MVNRRAKLIEMFQKHFNPTVADTLA